VGDRKKEEESKGNARDEGVIWQMMCHCCDGSRKIRQWRTRKEVEKADREMNLGQSGGKTTAQQAIHHPS
jgi:hypothetical protein